MDTDDQEMNGELESSLSEMQNCTKNKGHSNLIPIEDFSVDDLQFNFRQKELVELIKLLGYLTVKVTVPYCSPERPNKRRPCNENSPRIGTGKICDVRKVTSLSRDERCPCSSCASSGNPANSWAEIKIVTSSSVVFDDDEGRHATCLFGFDNADSQGVPLEGVGIATLEKEICHLQCVTHDLQLADELASNLMAYKSGRVRFFNDYKDSNVETKLIAVVSHPHGQFKHVSIKVDPSTDQDVSPSKKNVLDTCEGSPGAPAYILDKDKNWLSTYC
uniref:Uncharacterized protein n=1 Tax=Biomphalaria glabrata TaxID=6526 RepID=A0A2C9LSK0_BIOGL